MRSGSEIERERDVEREIEKPRVRDGGPILHDRRPESKSGGTQGT
jgi:hypothetical protein